MKTIDDGGPAFPVSTDEWRRVVHDGVAGMSLRDWFAGQALTGMLAPDYSYDYDRAAQHAYAFADAMLAEMRRRGEAT